MKKIFSQLIIPYFDKAANKHHLTTFIITTITRTEKLNFKNSQLLSSY